MTEVEVMEDVGSLHTILGILLARLGGKVAIVDADITAVIGGALKKMVVDGTLILEYVPADTANKEEAH